MEKILIVSSAKKSKELLVEIIKSSGNYEIESVDDKISCQEIIKNKDFDLIIINAPLKDDYGERSVNAKLTNRQAYKIREMWKNGVPQNIIAQKFHISKQTVCNVVHYKTYIK